MEPIKKFTYKKYIELLRTLKEVGYEFLPFDIYDGLLQPYVLLRHDIDLDFDKAVTMSWHEYTMKVQATYFIMLRNDFYNVFSKEGRAAVDLIIKNGHKIGLHFDCSAYPDDYSISNLREACYKEIELLADCVGDYVHVVSYHRPNDKIMDNDGRISGEYINVYMKKISKVAKYYSDSRGEWKYGYPLDSEQFEKRKPLHLTIHPVWWNNEHVSPYDVLLNFRKRRWYNTDQSLENNCEVWR